MVNGSAAAMDCGQDRSGAGRVTCGIGFPMGPNNGQDRPVEVLDTIRSPGLGEAGLAAVPGGNLHRIMRLSAGGS